MTQITASLVKDLREKTGAGMMDCKKALIETAGEIEPAIDWLRKKGLAAAAKKAGRVAAEGLVGISVGEGRAAVVEVNAETDFVSRNEQFQAFVRTVADLALEAGGDIGAIKAKTVASGRTVEDELTHLVATIGENMSLRRAAMVSVEHGCVATYMHSAQAPNLGRIGVLVGLGGVDPSPALEALGKQLAMHVAAANPQAIARANVDPKALERERNILSEQALASGKPPQIVEKMVEGRLSKYFKEVVLLEQGLVMDPDKTVGKAAQEAGAKIAAFRRFQLGEAGEE
jgi:elongation factor Ts